VVDFVIEIGGYKNTPNAHNALFESSLKLNLAASFLGFSSFTFFFKLDLPCPFLDASQRKRGHLCHS
jgi:hypothetical protein